MSNDMTDLPEGFEEYIGPVDSGTDMYVYGRILSGYKAGIAQGRREPAELLDLIKAAANYLDINEKTYIASTSILHNKFKQAIRRAAGEQDD